jgi:hypothetical protein
VTIVPIVAIVFNSGYRAGNLKGASARRVESGGGMLYGGTDRGRLIGSCYEKELRNGLNGPNGANRRR